MTETNFTLGLTSKYQYLAKDQTFYFFFSAPFPFLRYLESFSSWCLHVSDDIVVCLLWVVAMFYPLAIRGWDACGPSPIPPFHLKQDLQEEEKPKSWDLPRTWQLATHRICRNTFHLRLHLRFRFRLRLCLPLHSQDSLKTRV